MPLDTPPILLIQPSVAHVRYFSAGNSQLVASRIRPAKQASIAHGGMPAKKFVSERVTRLTREKFAYLPFQSMKLPAGGLWTMPAWQAPYENRYRLELCLKGDTSAVLTFACEGVPYDKEYSLQAILSEPAHQLSLKEKESLYPKIADDVLACTEVLNGKHVLCKEFESEGKKWYCMLFNLNPDNTSSSKHRFILEYSMPLEKPPVAFYQTPPAHIKYIDFKAVGMNHALVAKYAQAVGQRCPERVSTQTSEHFTSLQKSALGFLPFKSMSLPYGGFWTQPFEEVPQEHSYRIELGPKNDKETTLTVTSQGSPYIASYPIPKFLEQKKIHSLTREERDLLSPNIAARDKAYTTDLNGKRVFIEETEVKGKKLYRLEFNHNPDGTLPFIPAVISFEAPTRKYNKYIASIKKCLSTIVWIDKVDIPVP
ncbi:MAG: hypothetical protein IPP97_26575 [Candidatus Obscuribacter sp.]|nr:hypothetical protein [Candidatus Obscuribacter sp.]